VEPSILFITSAKINMLEDIIHEGLDELLGPERVICYPYKDYSEFQYNLYPPSAQKDPHRHPVGRARLQAMKDAIRAVIIGSVRNDAVATWRELENLFPGRPVALINGEEDHKWPSGVRATHRFELDLPPGRETRELHPLPLACPSRVMLDAEVTRDIPVSFIARMTHAYRLRCVDILRREGFMVLFGADLPREQYCWLLCRSKISVSVRGGAYDTLRYWEIPYAGALLLSQRLPIDIPDNFRDWESAVFFDDPQDMVRQIRALLADEERLSRIAEAGKKLAREKHTAVGRARYLLDKLGLGVSL